jgi:hypothetical protein
MMRFDTALERRRAAGAAREEEAEEAISSEGALGQ